MSNRKKRRVFKKYTIRFGLFIAVIVFLSSIGFVLSTHFSDINSLAFLPSKNDVTLILWRLCLYGTVIALMTPQLLQRVNMMKLHISERMTQTLLHCRSISFVSMVMYECFIVQNGFKPMIQWGVKYVS